MVSSSDTSQPPHPLAEWTHDAEDIPDAGLKSEWEAVPEVSQQLAEALQVLRVESVRVAYEIKRLRGSKRKNTRYSWTGKLDCRLIQECVVTLDPIAQHIVETIDEEFHPQADIEPAGREESEILSQTDPEPIVDGKLEVGRVVFEYLSAAIDPFPRRDGESLEWQDKVDDAEAEAANPFAALSKLKGKT